MSQKAPDPPGRLPCGSGLGRSESPLGESDDGPTVSAVDPSRKALGVDAMNGLMPYFRCYAADWIARSVGLSAHAQLLVFRAVCVAWSESKSGTAARSVSEWASSCALSEEQVVSAARQLSSRAWVETRVEGELLTIRVPEMDDQAEIVTKERDKTRDRRSGDGNKGQTRGQTRGQTLVPIDRGSELRGSERSAGRRSPPKGSAPATEDEKHGILGSVIKPMLAEPR